MFHFARLYPRLLVLVPFALAACLDTTGITSNDDDGGSDSDGGAADLAGLLDAGAAADAGAAPPDLVPPSDSATASDLCTDNDKDGVTTCDGDCDDNNASNFPGNGEVC